MPRATVPVALASTRIEPSTVPMHGAAQTANAAPSSALEPSPRTQRGARARAPLRPGQQAGEREPEDDEQRSRRARSALLRQDRRRSRRRRRRAATKTTVKPSDERQAPRDATRAPARRAASRDDRQVAGHERQHARGGDGDEPGEEAPPRSGRSLERAGSSSSGRRVHRHASTVSTRAADERARRAAAPTRAGRSRSARGAASTPLPNWATSWSLISLFVSPAAIRVRTNCFMCSAIGAFDWSSVVWQVGQTSSPSSSACVGCCSLASAAGATASASDEDARASLTTSAFRIASSRSASSVIAPTCARRSSRRRSTKNVSGKPVIPHGSQSFAGPSYAIRYVSPCSSTKFLRVAVEVPHVDADEDDAVVVPLRRALEQRRLGAARHAPRRPEVDHHRLADVVRDRHPPVAGERRQVEVRHRLADASPRGASSDAIFQTSSPSSPSTSASAPSCPATLSRRVTRRR